MEQLLDVKYSNQVLTYDQKLKSNQLKEYLQILGFLITFLQAWL